MFYQEIDTGSARTRFQRTMFAYKTVNDDIVDVAWCSNIDDHWYLRKVDKATGRFKDVVIPFSDLLPKYHPIPSGFYHALDEPSRIYCVTRKMVRSMVVGLGQHNFNVDDVSDDPKLGRFVDILNPVKPDKEKALRKNYGALSNKLFIRGGNLYYLNQHIGFKNGSTFIVEPVFKSEIEDCVRGHECKIRLC